MSGSEINEAKKILADEATSLLHGREAAIAAREASSQAFEKGQVSDDLPTLEVARDALEAGIALAALAVDAGLAGSRSDARRLAQGGGLRVNDAAEADGQRLVTLADVSADGVIKLAAGKKKIVLIRPV